MPKSGSDPILDDLTEPQREAVTYGEGPLLVVAGAGSGKTRVITRRIAHLARRGVPPDRIVAITFTNKAADEMRRRVETLVGKDVTVSTFHSLCARMLRRDIQHIGMEASFSIYDRTDSARIVRQVCREMNLSPETYRPAELLDRISAHKDRVESPDQVAREAVGIFDQAAAEVYRRYNARLADANALDFDDLLVKTVELFSVQPEALQRYQQTYLHVLVDEYQDTNLPQHLIARALQGRHRNITAVGDPDQMIYSWRGARLENIMEFEQDFPGTHIVKLERNYRSTANILRAASTCISFNTLRHEKVLWTDRAAGEPVRVQQFADSYEEAEWVAETVKELIGGDVAPNDIAVLYRTKYQSLQVEEALAARSLPCQVVDTVGFFDRKLVKDLRAYLQLLLNARDDEAFLRVVNVPSRGIGAKTLEKLAQISRQAGKPLCLAIRDPALLGGIGPRARRALEEFRQMYDRLAALRCDSVFALLKEIVRETSYVSGVSDEDREDAQEVLDYFLGYAKQYDKRHPGGDLTGFMEQTALVSDVDGWNATAKAVPLMTLHSGKGLEFDVVFIVGLDEGILPHQRALEESAHGDELHALEEERRLFHVGMTRARDRLYLTHVRTRMIRGQDQPVGPSRFLDELPHEGVESETSDVALKQDDPARLFAGEAQRVAAQKRKTVKAAGSTPLLRVVDGSDDGSFRAGARVVHASYGEGVVVAVDSAGRHHMVRVNFEKHGVLTLLLPAQ
jgi:DNA helicase-2/ATP-dependent DNA helicase PcrA